MKSPYVNISIESLIHNFYFTVDRLFQSTIMGITSQLLALSSTARGLTATTIALAVIILASNFTITNAQQSLTSQPGEIENGITATTVPRTTFFQSTNDSFSIQVPDGWVIQDPNNTGSALLEETTRGYGMLAQLCPEEEEQPAQQGAQITNDRGSANSSSSGTNTSSCQGSEEVMYIIRYPDLDTRIRAANNVTTSNSNITTDNVLSYHLQKLQEVGYRSIQTINSTEVRVNLTSPQTNETITTVPAKVVEIAYNTNSAPNEIRRGYFILTATTGTPPNLGTTKGYAIFYEGNSTVGTPGAEITAVTSAASGSLAPTPLPPAVRQAFDSFELIAAPEIAQTIAQDAQSVETTDGGDIGANDDDNGGSNDNNNNDDDDDDDDNGGSNDNNNNDDDDDDDDNGGSNDNNNNDDDNGSDEGTSSRGPEHNSDDYDADDDAGDNGGGDNGGGDNGGGDNGGGDNGGGDDDGA